MSNRMRDIGYTLASVVIGIVAVELQRWFRKRKLNKDFDSALCTKQYVKVVVSASMSMSNLPGEEFSTCTGSVDFNRNSIVDTVKSIVYASMPDADVKDISFDNEYVRVVRQPKESLVPKQSEDILELAEAELKHVLCSDEILSLDEVTKQLKFAVGISSGIVLVRESLYVGITWAAVEDVLTQRKRYGISCMVLDDKAVQGAHQQHKLLESGGYTKTLLKEAVVQAWNQIILDNS